MGGVAVISNKKRPRLTPEQMAVVRLSGGPARVLAGAGSGKTHTMTEMISKKIRDFHDEYSDEEGVAADRVLAITFTVKAAEEMRERLAGRVGGAAAKLDVSNFHRLAFEISRDNAARLGVDPEAPVLRRPRAWMMILDDLSSDDLSLRRLDLSNPASVAEDTLRLLGEARNERVSLENLEERTLRDLESASDPGLRALFERRLDLTLLARRFEGRREESGRLQFADMIEAAVRVLESDDLGEAYRDRYDLVVVDEFQDTNPAQLRLVELLSSDKSGPDLSKVVVIGDDLQSIFNFQGAAIRNIQRFEEHAGLHINDATYRLKRNFRSATRILDFANFVAKEVHPEDSPDEVKTLAPMDDAPTGNVRTFVSETDASEAEEIAERIKKLLSDGENAGECAVLIRKWSQAPAVAKALESEGITVEVVRGGDLLGSHEVAYLTDILRVFSDLDRHRTALVRVLSRDPYMLSDGDLEAAFGAPGGFRVALHKPENVAGISEEAARRVRAFSKVLDALEEGMSRVETLEEFIEGAVEDVGLGREVRSIPTDSARRVALHGLEAFREVAGEFGGVEHLGEFLRYIEVSEGSRSTEATKPPEVEGDAVILTTIHGAKGLEFDHVFIPGLSKGVFPDTVKVDNPLKKASSIPSPLKANPSRESIEAYDAMDEKALEAALRREAGEEEGRLFYVAITRARESLTLSRSHFYTTNKKVKPGGGYFRMSEEAPRECAIEAAPEPEVPEANPNIREAEFWEKPEGDEWTLRAASGGMEEEVAIAGELGVVGYDESLHSLREDVRAIPEVERPEYVLPAPEVHSPSSLMEFEVCARRYYYGHVFPVVSAVEKDDGSRERGDAWHKWIEAGMEGEEPPTEAPMDDSDADELREPRPERTDSKPAPKTPLEKTEYGMKTREYPLHENHVPPKNGPVRMVEVPFAVEIGGSEIKGRIDAIFVDEDGTFHIIDWKSGHPSAHYAERLQLPIYALAANKLWNVAPENMRLAYVFAGGEKVSINIGENFLEEKEAEVEKLLEEIRAGRFEPRPSVYACRFCPVFGIGIEGCPGDESELKKLSEGRDAG